MTLRRAFAKCLGILFAFLFISSNTVEGQTPPINDDYADRLVVTGSSITVTGALASATWEDPYEPVVNFFPGWQTGTIWWSWTPSESTPVVLWAHRLKESSPTWFDVITVWTNLCPEAFDEGYSICSGVGYVQTPIVTDVIPYGAMAFRAEQGLEHFVQLMAAPDAEYIINWVATNVPVIIEQPVSRTVSSGRSALFKVVAMGLPPMDYQWTFQGADLPGANDPMLTLDDVALDQEGDYVVRITCATGTILSEMAALSVEPLTPAPQLISAGNLEGGGFGIQLHAESSRSYRIESSTNLLDWGSQVIGSIGVNQWTSVVVMTNEIQSLVISRDEPRKFLRAAEYIPPNHECINNLKEIRFAKDMWVLEGHKLGMHTPADFDLLPYWFNGQKPQCPDGGYYIHSANESLPQCSIPNHILEEPRFP